jgi:hypothetical protein
MSQNCVPGGEARLRRQQMAFLAGRVRSSHVCGLKEQSSRAAYAPAECLTYDKEHDDARNTRTVRLYVRELRRDQRPPCPTCTEMMVVQRRGEVFIWACVRATRCRGTLPLNQETFRAWAQRHGVQLEPMPARYTPPPHCPQCDFRMTLRCNTQGTSKFWRCSKFPKCNATRSYET